MTLLKGAAGRGRAKSDRRDNRAQSKKGEGLGPTAYAPALFVFVRVRTCVRVLKLSSVQLKTCSAGL